MTSGQVEFAFVVWRVWRAGIGACTAVSGTNNLASSASLLSLLGSGKAQEHAARAIAKVAHRNGTVQAEVCKSGGIATLLAMLSDRNVEAQIQAAAALSEIAQGEDGLGHRRTQNAISKAGGIGPLLAMVEAIPIDHRAV